MSFEQTPQLNLEKVEEGKEIKEEETKSEKRIKEEEKIIIDYFGEEEGKEIIEKIKEKPEVKEMVDYLIQDVFPYFGLTVEEEVRTLELLNNEECVDGNIKRVAVQSFKMVRQKILDFFYKYSIQGFLPEIEKPFYEIKFKLSVLREEIEKQIPSNSKQNLLKVVESAEEEVDKIIEKLKSYPTREEAKQFLFANSYFGEEWWAQFGGFFSGKDTLSSLDPKLRKIIEDTISNYLFMVPLTGREVEYLNTHSYKVNKEEIFSILKEEFRKLEKTGTFVCKNIPLDPLMLKLIFESGLIMPVPELREYLFERWDIPPEEREALLRKIEQSGAYAGNPQEWNKILGFERNLTFGSLIGGQREDFLKGGAPSYGNVFFIFNLDKLKNRATATQDDSTLTRRKEALIFLPLAKILKAQGRAEERLLKAEYTGLSYYMEVQVVNPIDIQEAESININLEKTGIEVKGGALVNATRTKKYGELVKYYEIEKNNDLVSYFNFTKSEDLPIIEILNLLDSVLKKQPLLLSKICFIVYDKGEMVTIGFRAPTQK